MAGGYIQLHSLDYNFRPNCVELANKGQRFEIYTVYNAIYAKVHKVRMKVTRSRS